MRRRGVPVPGRRRSPRIHLDLRGSHRGPGCPGCLAPVACRGEFCGSPCVLLADNRIRSRWKRKAGMIDPWLTRGEART